MNVSPYRRVVSVPNSKVHWGFSLLLWLMLLTGNLYVNPIFVIIGSLLPDADIRGSIASRFLPLYIWMKHRTYTHRIWVAVPVCGALALYNPYWGGGLFVGWFSHLMLDSCTKSGLRIWGFISFVLPFSLPLLSSWLPILPPLA
jgi:membrane-bound metal-dependent hydrolase YbcI (DUF457 family)